VAYFFGAALCIYYIYNCTANDSCSFTRFCFLQTEVIDPSAYLFVILPVSIDLSLYVLAAFIIAI